MENLKNFWSSRLERYREW